MKKLFFTILFIMIISLFVVDVNAQMMHGFSNSSADWDKVVEHTLREEKEGKELWEKVRAKEINCAAIDDEQFGVLGEYFMGQMMGDSHTAMNAMIIQMHGEDGEEQIHIVMGKRLSGCDPNAIILAQGQGWMPMMQMMWGGWSSPSGYNQTHNTMMNWGYSLLGFGIFAFFLWLLYWVFIITIAVFLIRWAINWLRGIRDGKSALDILKERYARGEIDKKEFEEKRKDLQ